MSPKDLPEEPEVVPPAEVIEEKSEADTIVSDVAHLNPNESVLLKDEDAEAQIRRMSRRSFLWAAIAAGATFGGLRWMNTRRLDDGIVWPLRRALDATGEISQDFFSTARLAPQYPRLRARTPRENGDYGLGEDFDVAAWTLSVSGLASGEDLELTLADIKKLPKLEMTTELKCIEGWATIVNWGGVRLLDFMKKYPPNTISGNSPDFGNNLADLLPYVSLVTPDGAYYVGLDMASALHPQTMLCYEMNGKPLTLAHGAPLRLVTPVKYGIKYIKRLGQITYTALRPADFWAEQGYDWYAGH